MKMKREIKKTIEKKEKYKFNPNIRLHREIKSIRELRNKRKLKIERRPKKFNTPQIKNQKNIDDTRKNKKKYQFGFKKKHLQNKTLNNEKKQHLQNRNSKKSKYKRTVLQKSMFINNPTSGEIEYRLISSNFTEIENLIDHIEDDDCVSELNTSALETYPNVIKTNIEKNYEDRTEVKILDNIITAHVSENLKKANTEINMTNNFSRRKNKKKKYFTSLNSRMSTKKIEEIKKQQFEIQKKVDELLALDGELEQSSESNSYFFLTNTPLQKNKMVPTKENFP
jgi:hypothetical protein